MGKILAIYCAVALLAMRYATADNEFYLTREFTRAFPEPKCEDKDLGDTVCDSCHSFKVCLLDGELSKIQQCPKELPNCVNGICTKEVNKEPSCAEGLQCTGEGYFPNPRNCSQYYYCEDKMKPPIKYDCPPKHVANPPSLLCVPKKTPADCHVINCTALKNTIYAPYRPNRMYYALCVKQNPVVFKCPNEYEQFSEKIHGCAFRCPNEGLFQVKDAPKKYRICNKVNNTLVWEERECPADLVFECNKQRCVKTAKGNQEDVADNNKDKAPGGEPTDQQTDAPADE